MKEKIELDLYVAFHKLSIKKMSENDRELCGYIDDNVKNIFFEINNNYSSPDHIYRVINESTQEIESFINYFNSIEDVSHFFWLDDIILCNDVKDWDKYPCFYKDVIDPLSDTMIEQNEKYDKLSIMINISIIEKFVPIAIVKLK